MVLDPDDPFCCLCDNLFRAEHLMQGKEKERHENQFILNEAFDVGEGDQKDMRIKSK